MSRAVTHNIITLPFIQFAVKLLGLKEKQIEFADTKTRRLSEELERISENGVRQCVLCLIY